MSDAAKKLADEMETFISSKLRPLSDNDYIAVLEQLEDFASSHAEARKEELAKEVE